MIGFVAVLISNIKNCRTAICGYEKKCLNLQMKPRDDSGASEEEYHRVIGRFCK